MSELNIVLVEPQIPQNTGNIARTCAATGCVLHLVRPMGFAVDDKKLKRAGLDYWYLLDIRYHDNLDAFFKTENPQSCFFFSTKAERNYSQAIYPDGSYLVFGREDAGLPEELLRKYYSQCVRLPILEGARSLNLSNTVAVAVYEALRQQGFSALKTKGFISAQSIPKDGGPFV